MALHLVHGIFHMTVMQASDLTDEHRRTGNAPKFIRKLVEGVEDAVKLGKGSSQLYVSIDMQTSRVGRTRVIKEEVANPVWNEAFHIYCAYNVANVTVSVKDDNPVGSTVLGQAKIPVSDILSGEIIDQSYDLYHEDGKKLKGDARIHLKMQYFDISTDPFVGRGVMNQKFPGVPYTFFRHWKGCKVTLFQDTHMPNNFTPKIYLGNGKLYEPHRCWEELFMAINEAKHLIYITGWSVYTKITMVRDVERPVEGAEGVTLGDLLKKKADEGVRVNLLVWDDRTSVGIFKKDGLMATHDEDTEAYFKDSQVNCVLCPRNPDAGLSVVQEIQVSTMFTHHQKTVIVDAAMPCQSADSPRRRIVSFIGGIDLCDGRYDTQFHSLFRTLDTVHHNDFHQPNFGDASIEKGGPREPWHDIHCKLEGQVAWDVLHNFEQRWEKQGRKDVLLTLGDVDSIIPPSPVTFAKDPNTWHVQVFRSIDGGAVFGFPVDNPDDAAKAGLVSGKDSTIDRSIQDAYIHAIRRAKNFIYIENQYFLGSCATWDADQTCGCLHLIPIELALKIASKIEAGERFSVYIVVPMWPEGVPESGSVQAILDWQHKTMEMMYKIIAVALQAKQIYDQSPRDYLTFFCLGNREKRLSNEYVPPNSPPDDSNYKKAQDHRRFMIYVHAKMMIVDDEYIIIGSANINQRSMDGGRDSEIAMGAYQPAHTGLNHPPKAEIHGFRMSLWYEHMGRLDDAFVEPWTLDCIHKVNKIGDELWDMYSGEPVVDLPGHLLTYPVVITNEGTVTEMPGTHCFPDTKAPIIGTHSDVLPPILTC